MIRILHILDSLDYGGIESFIINMYKEINRSEVQFDFLIFKEKNCYENIVHELGGRVYKYDINDRNKIIKAIKSIRVIRKTIINGEYKIIHCHNCSLIGLLKATITGKICKCTKTVIAHSHNTGMPKNTWFDNKIRLILKALVDWSSDYYFACSKEAALSKYSSKLLSEKNQRFRIIHNAIDIKKFQYNDIERKEIRKKLDVVDKFVIGHVGRFEYQKNHLFLIRVFKEVLDRKADAVLLLVGGGSLEKKIKKEISNLKIKDKVIFLGKQKDISDIYKCMDVFVFPSYFEGLGIALIEAQISGLPCIISDNIPNEAKLTNKVKAIGLEEDVITWANKILENNMNEDRKVDISNIKKRGYDLAEEARKLEYMYLSMYNYLNTIR
ncbi:glycosyltransferase family 1 protein [Clostridium butyricum]|uniref:glycosyltransferase family 1 protein n=1 Tax=Clostridium butyricum TaxID=1492 RepID=UPI000DE8272D|nr:glycosyltransferase family 1 protein [Clostridium butyricum]AXB83695.1 glycosyltransferase family 1 protein [Clostridium butyricum]